MAKQCLLPSLPYVRLSGLGPGSDGSITAHCLIFNNFVRDGSKGAKEETTGITVEPTKVRLVTKQSDSYTWCCVKDVAHLFSKNLSDHGMAACKELYDGVGHSFHTVL
ncbi:hypothetical protein B0J13DRAFT_574302 [Dactylonectria estremocensis]|uniref:Uncharacterized protein n=1 Tax=Dactylonectria estremocensis TaxID=1079267 RepID=A0A9P9IBB7_9HYPO|nr:hypothetical protein B0J13DRAFT_574302 [Dactylonectria estremocensis]